MAEVVQDFRFKDCRTNGRYPWHEWTDGQAWKIVRGKDFNTSRTCMRSHIYGTAARLGLKVRISVPEVDVIVFQFFKDAS